MANNNKVFVSPGVYTSEKDITIVTRNIGVTTLGAVGETTKGPAFQPIFISNYDEFTKFFGGLNSEIIKDNFSPKYELPYIAKSYLKQSNQLFVTRVLGLTGYDAGLAWGITLDANVDLSTSATTSSSTNYSNLATFNVSLSANTVTSLTANPIQVQSLYDNNLLNLDSFILNNSINDTTSFSPTFYKVTENGNSFNGASLNVLYTSVNYTLNPTTTGTTGTSAFTSLYTFQISGGVVTNVSFNDTTIDSLYDNNVTVLNNVNNFLTGNTVGGTLTIAPSFYNNEANYIGAGFTNQIISTGSTGVGSYSGIVSGNVTYYSGISNDTVSGTLSGNVITYSASSYSDVENKLVALLRSRGKINNQELLELRVSGASDLIIDQSTNTLALTNPLASFILSGQSSTGTFSYPISFNKTKKDYLTRVLGKTNSDATTAVYVEEIYQSMLDNLLDANKVRGINLNLINYSNLFNNYKREYSEAKTPYIVSELRGNEVMRLFRFITITDGNAANTEYKISITNIKPDLKEFDVIIRSYFDTDANPNILERFSRCTMDPSSANFIGRRIGTIDGNFTSRSKYVLVEMNDSIDTSDAFPSGFLGYPIRDYQVNSNNSVVNPNIIYKTSYGQFENKRKYFLGLSTDLGIDSDFFNYKGVKPNGEPYSETTLGFHMDLSASSVMLEGQNVEFSTGLFNFQTDANLTNTDYEDLRARKFTLVPYGGFDGWDIYRTRRTNTDSYRINGSKSQLGLLTGTFEQRSLSNGETGTNSDYYAYLEGVRTFSNPEDISINVLVTPGIDTFDNTSLIDETIEMVETERADAIYIVTTPDVDSSGEPLDTSDVASRLDGLFDSNYVATYYPWVQVVDDENNSLIYLPPTSDVVRNIALTDKVAFPWFAVAGFDRGNIDALKSRIPLTNSQRDILYEARVNPLLKYQNEGIKIWGNKTMQIADTVLEALNVRRLLLQTRKLVSNISVRLLFDQADDTIRNKFISQVTPILNNIRKERGFKQFKIVVPNDPESLDRGELNGQIIIQPNRALEIITIEFVATNTGATFTNI